MRSFCFEIIYGILLIVQKGHSTPDGQRVALNVRPLQPKRFFLAKPAVQTEGAEYAGAWFYDYTHQNIDLIGKQSLFLFRFSVRGDFDTLSRIINNQIQLSFLGCAGYVVIGNTITEPSTAYDRRGLLPAGPQSRIWYTPFFSTDIWYLRRQWAQIELLMKPVCRQTEQAEPEPKKDDAAPPLCETKTGQLTFF